MLAEEMKPSRMFFDDIDLIAPQRRSGNENEAARKMKVQLLTSLGGEGSGSESSVFILAATNLPWDLDGALVRRSQRRIYVPMPDRDGRMVILRMHLTDYTDETFDFNAWAERLDGYSRSDLTNLCRDAVQMVWGRQLLLMGMHAFVNLSADEAKGIVSNHDFGWAMAKRKPSVTPKLLKKYNDWKEQRGID
jgi:katanin p60 ATPase-containing subunit A1